MSATKRSRQRPAEAPLVRSPSHPATKRIKSSHVPARSGLEFLVDEDARAGKKLEARLTNGVPRSQTSRVAESHAVVAPDSEDDSSSSDNDGEEQEQKQSKTEPDIIDISSGEEESSELDEDDDEDQNQQDSETQEPPLTNGHTPDDPDRIEEQQVTGGVEDAEMKDDDGNADGAEEPTFGDLLRARHPEPIDLQNALQGTGSELHGLVSTSRDQIIPTGHTLGTLLSQALKNNDKDMLETCLALTDQTSIRATIQRQSSREAAMLLEKIAERIHRGPGRTGGLLTWIQWSLVCHGGYMAHQPELMKKIRSVAQVLRQRASGLQPLLHLKGKLDLLTAQLELRRSMQQASRSANMTDQDDENGVLYIEGQDEDWSDSDEDTSWGQSKKRSLASRVGKVPAANDDEVEDEDEEDDELNTGLPNGIGSNHDQDSSDGQEDEDEDEVDGVTDEASDEEEEESSNGEEASEASSADEDESSEDDASDVDAVKQAKPSTLHRKR